MIKDTIQIRPRYSEVDQMGYVYHSNYVDYCHQARTELMRKIGIEDSVLEEKNIILPVVSFHIDYKNPAHYDENLLVSTHVKEIPKLRFDFHFEIYNTKQELICKASSTIVFADKKTRHPLRTPGFVKEAIKKYKLTNNKNI